jgi:o-succinylbenzoate synthase
LIELYKYQLPFKNPFVTGKGEFHHREGVLVRYSDHSGEVLTEASPLPGFSKESIDSISGVLKEKQNDLNEFLSKPFTIQNLQEILEDFPNLPSLLFALSFLGLQILSNRKDKSLYELFDCQKSPIIQVNDIISIQDLNSSLLYFKKSRNQGFKTFKLKCGFPVDSQIQILSKLRQNSDHELKFRLDANQSWPEKQTLSSIQKLKTFDIEYIEEPFKWDNLEVFKNISDQSPIPLALDESIQSIEHLKTFLRELPESFLVIKPMLLGNLIDLFETIRGERTHFNRIVVTTTLESSIGRSMAASAATLIGDPNLAHGLNTGYLFHSDLSDDPEIERGEINVPISGFRNFKLNDLNQSLLSKF